MLAFLVCSRVAEFINLIRPAVKQFIRQMGIDKKDLISWMYLLKVGTDIEEFEQNSSMAISLPSISPVYKERTISVLDSFLFIAIQGKYKVARYQILIQA
jgi:hypothetical protein